MSNTGVLVDIENDADAILQVCSYDRRGLDPVVVWSSPHEMHPVRRSLQKPFVKPPIAHLGMLGRLPAEIMLMILRALDIRSLFRFRQVNRLARVHSAGSRDYRLVAKHGLEALRGLLRAELAHLFTIQDLYQSLVTDQCAACGSFGGFLFLPTAERTCAGCLQSSSRFRVVPPSTFAELTQVSPARLRDLVGQGLRTVPRIKSAPTGTSPHPPEYLISEERARQSLLAVGALTEDAVRNLAAPRDEENHRFLAAIAHPYYDSKKASVERGVSCKGCLLRCTDPIGRDRDRAFSNAAFLTHVIQCVEAQDLWIQNEGDESKLWEDEYLRDSSISQALQTDSILLKLQAGSQEAGFLAALFPLPKTPTLVIIKNGELKDYIASGVSKVDFLTRVGRALPGSTPIPAAASAAAPAAAQSAHETAATAAQSPTASAAVDSSSSSSSSAPPQDRAELVKAAMARREREKKEALRKRKEAEEARRKAAEESTDETAKPQAAGRPRDEVQKAAEERKKRQQEELEARRRVLKQIEDDRAERRSREELRKREREAAAALAEGAGGEADATGADISLVPHSALASRETRNSEECALQVRLFDGSTIRTRFPSSNTLRTDVRKWVEDSRTDDRGPFTFRSLFPSRLIDETEEDKTLQELGLTPSSTLVLVRVDKFSDAYDDSNAGILSRIIGAIVHFFTMVLTFFTTIFSSPPPAPEASQPSPQGASRQERGQRDNGRVQGFRNPNDSQRDQQLYNGNSLNFEPRNDGDDNAQ